jgi:hypothetical protein
LGEYPPCLEDLAQGLPDSNSQMADQAPFVNVHDDLALGLVEDD